MSTKACFRGKAFPGKPAKITFGENKDVNSSIKFRLYNNSFAPALGGACAMGFKRTARTFFGAEFTHVCHTSAKRLASDGMKKGRVRATV